MAPSTGARYESNIRFEAKTIASVPTVDDWPWVPVSLNRGTAVKNSRVDDDKCPPNRALPYALQSLSMNSFFVSLSSHSMHAFRRCSDKSRVVDRRAKSRYEYRCGINAVDARVNDQIADFFWSSCSCHKLGVTSW